MQTTVSFNVLDLLLILVFLAFLYKGYRARFFKEFVSFFGLMLAITAGLAGVQYFSPWLFAQSALTFGGSAVVAFLLPFGLVKVAYHYLENLIHRHARLEMTEKIDRFFGGLVGTIKGLLISSLIALALALAPITDTVSQYVATSLFHANFETIGPAIYNRVHRFIPGSQPFVAYLENAVEAVEQQQVEQRVIDVLIDLNSRKVETWSDSKAKK